MSWNSGLGRTEVDTAPSTSNCFANSQNRPPPSSATQRSSPGKPKSARLASPTSRNWRSPPRSSATSFPAPCPRSKAGRSERATSRPARWEATSTTSSSSATAGSASSSPTSPTKECQPWSWPPAAACSVLPPPPGPPTHPGPCWNGSMRS